MIRRRGTGPQPRIPVMTEAMALPRAGAAQARALPGMTNVARVPPAIGMTATNRFETGRAHIAGKKAVTPSSASATSCAIASVSRIGSNRPNRRSASGRRSSRTPGRVVTIDAHGEGAPARSAAALATTTGAPTAAGMMPRTATARAGTPPKRCSASSTSSSSAPVSKPIASQPPPDWMPNRGSCPSPATTIGSRPPTPRWSAASSDLFPIRRLP